MKLAKEIAEAIENTFFLVKREAGLRTIGEIDEATSIIAAKLEPVGKALRELFDKSDVNDYNHVEYEAAEEALVLLSGEE